MGREKTDVRRIEDYRNDRYLFWICKSAENNRFREILLQIENGKNYPAILHAPFTDLLKK